MRNPGTLRQGFGIHSFGVLPICRGEKVIALLEVDWKKEDVPVEEADLETLRGFAPYVAMAVVDCKLQVEFSKGQVDVDEILKVTERWTE